MALAHRHRELAFPGAVELAEPAVAKTVGIVGDVLVPQDRQRHVLALELAMDDAAMTLPRSDLAAEPILQNCVGQVRRQRPADPRGRSTLQRLAHRGRRKAQPPGDLAAGNPRAILQP